jgi:hypothetical protein
VVTEAKPHQGTSLALLGLHARAVRTAAEIRLLAMNGFAAGAEARARSLHELAVTSCVIGDADEVVANRYLAFVDVERCDDAVQYQRTRRPSVRHPSPKSNSSSGAPRSRPS